MEQVAVLPSAAMGYRGDMARPKDADPAATRRHILQCACDLLANSDEAFSLRAVARSADVSIGALQYHFADKQTLIDACIDTVYDTFKELAPTMGAKLASAKSSEEFLDQAVRFGFRYSRENQPFIRILEASIVKNGGLDLTRHKSVQEPFLRAASQLLAANVSNPPGDMELRLNSVVTLIGRYAILQESALASMFTPIEGQTVIEAVEEHLVSMTQTILSTSLSR